MVLRPPGFEATLSLPPVGLWLLYPEALDANGGGSLGLSGAAPFQNFQGNLLRVGCSQVPNRPLTKGARVLSSLKSFVI